MANLIESSQVQAFKQNKRQVDDRIVMHAAKRGLALDKFHGLLDEHYDLYQDQQYVNDAVKIWQNTQYVFDHRMGD